MTQKAITIKDLAAKLNISVSTVSRALKDNPEISLQTRKTVQTLAKELGYRPNPIAVALKTHKSHTIGVVVPQIVNTFFANVVRKIEEIADKYGYNVLVASSNETFEKEQKNIDVFLANRTDGIILSISRATTSYDHIRNIQNQGVPLVLFDRTTKELEVSKVIADDADAAFKIVQHLIHGGAQKIAIITGPEQLSIGKNRMKGYLKAMSTNKLEINQDYIIRCDDFSVKAAKEATQKLLNLKEKPDAIFGINDDMAIGAIEAIKEKNIRIPEDIAVFGFSNTKRSRYMNPSVSTVNQFPEKIGEKAAELLFEQILNTKYAQIREEIVNCELIIRESSDRSYLND
ncbi:LacI family DNA-binding transcriptional regulator [Odoribacter lunatus]|uniref:LacI family DNA-binding transcriptional regulator n=1 Tax=Odoribacter lunatus TaxID=2941335 RepID=UPI00203F2DA7|nr:LacI family DNA-binding transcriptional regulator [Odoribacter lunatus]